MIEYDKYRFKLKEIPQHVKKEKNTYCLICKQKKQIIEKLGE